MLRTCFTLLVLQLCVICTYVWLSGMSSLLWALHIEDLKVVEEETIALVNKHCEHSDVVSFVPDEVLPWARFLRAARADIYDELLAYEQMEEGQYNPPFGALDPAQRLVNTRRECWKTIWLNAYGITLVTAQHFPKTMHLLKASRATSVMFSILGPKCGLSAHYGENKAILRYHLGIEVPPRTNESEQLELRVWHTPGQDRYYDENASAPQHVLTWANSSDLLFDDTFNHEVVNSLTSARRVVLFVDVLRHDCGTAFGLLLRALTFAVSRSSRIQNIVSKVNSWPLKIAAMNRMMNEL